MAVGSADLGKLYPVPGVRMSAVAAGLRKPGKLDLVLFELADQSVSAGIFTRNAFCAAPIAICKQHLQTMMPRYLLINTGNANAGTGAAGMHAAHRSCAELGALLDCPSEAVLPFSTGVIGELLPIDKLCMAMPELSKGLGKGDWETVARGIMTTDTRPKAVSRQVQIAGHTVTVTGIAKGAGMIKPNMATMLGYVFTDLAMNKSEVQHCVKKCADRSFNRISVDGDTSTNDSCLLIATGMSNVHYGSLSEEERTEIDLQLIEVFELLAQAIVRDAEGATKFVTLHINGGATEEECLKVGYAIAESPLIKTAIYASDPNWGRLLAAIGRAGLDSLKIEGIELYLDDVCIVSAGARASNYVEEQGQAVFSKSEFTIRVELGRGQVNETFWTCDFSHDYVSINANYRT